MHLDQYERSYCDCRKCLAACRHMPGMLSPLDVDRISDYMRVPDDDWTEWFRDHFVASEGAVVVRKGTLERIGTITPAQREDGSCVFLNDDGRCSIHPVAPFGCAQFDVCAGPEESDDHDAKSSACLQAIVQSPDYGLLWLELCDKGRLAPPLKERRQNLQAELDD